MGHTVKGRNFTRAIAAMRPERTAFRAVSALISFAFSKMRPQQDSNLRTRLRRPLLYPLSYGGLAQHTHVAPAGVPQTRAYRAAASVPGRRSARRGADLRAPALAGRPEPIASRRDPPFARPRACCGR